MAILTRSPFGSTWLVDGHVEVGRRHDAVVEFDQRLPGRAVDHHQFVAGSLRSHNVGCPAERSARRIEGGSSHSAWRGALGNDDNWIHSAMRRALKIRSEFELDVILVSYGTPLRVLLQMAEDFD